MQPYTGAIVSVRTSTAGCRSDAVEIAPTVYYTVAFGDDGTTQELKRGQFEVVGGDRVAPPVDADGYFTSGHPWIGQRLRRIFTDASSGTTVIADGRVTSWLPADAESDPALWHMLHDDGDEEYLDEAEVAVALAEIKRAKHGGP